MCLLVGGRISMLSLNCERQSEARLYAEFHCSKRHLLQSKEGESAELRRSESLGPADSAAASPHCLDSLALQI